jgi:outer membrane protein assembly factor BamD
LKIPIYAPKSSSPPLRRKPSLFAPGLLLSALLCSLGCAGKDNHADSAINYAENAKHDYEEAMEAFDSKNWETSDQLMNEVRRKYGYSRYARLAELRLADAHFQQDKFAEAVAGYKSFVHDYPNDPEVQYARYQVAKAQYESVSPSPLLPALEERDLASVNDAHATIRKFLNDYPDSSHSQELEYMQAVVTGLLARHELYVARFYLDKSNFGAATARIEYSLHAFPNSDLEPEALVLLAEVYMKQKERGKARELLTHVIHHYPDSAFIVPAKHFLEELGEPTGTLRMN